MIKNVDRIVEKINELEDIAKVSEKIFTEFFINIDSLGEHFTGSDLDQIEIFDELREKQREAKRLYQRFYTASENIIKEYAPSKFEEFMGCYKFNPDSSNINCHDTGVINYIELEPVFTIFKDKNFYLRKYLNRFETQRSILLSIPDVITVKNLNLKELISSEYTRDELEESELLFENEFYRAAGAIAGVSLERHLKFLCDKNEIEYSFKENMNRINEKLKEHDVFEKSQWNYVRYLGDLRNKCAHSGLEVITEKDARDLIDGTKKVIREYN